MVVCGRVVGGGDFVSFFFFFCRMRPAKEGKNGLPLGWPTLVSNSAVCGAVGLGRRINVRQ